MYVYLFNGLRRRCLELWGERFYTKVLTLVESVIMMMRK